MKGAALLVLVLSTHGYWLSGQNVTVTARWAAREKMPAADLVWEIGLGDIKLGGATVGMSPDDQPTIINVQAPDVRVRTTLRWQYRLIQRDGGKLLESGELPASVFPANLTDDWTARLGRRKLLVWDDADGLPTILSAAKIPFTRVDNLTNPFDRPDLILVGADRIGSSPFDESPLMNFARAGSSVAVLAQHRPSRLAGYPLARRELPDNVQFRTDHPLFDRLEPADLRSWASEAASAPAILLNDNEPALELAWWSPETKRNRPAGSAVEQPVPLDAMLVSRTIDAGRIVLCQIPVSDWQHDPRSQIFLGNLISYLTTRPEPTPPRNERHTGRPEVLQAAPANIAPSGAKR